MLHEAIASRAAKDTNNEISLLRVENDMVAAFFDSLARFSETFTHAFVEDLRRDVDTLVSTLFYSAGELVLFWTYMLVLLRKLDQQSTSFFSAIQLLKTLIARVQDDAGAPKHEFTVFFEKHLFRSYCQLISDDSAKRAFVCELLYAHTQHDLALRIRTVQSLKASVKNEEALYACYAFMIAHESTFNEEWFDVFLYYALIGLVSPKPYVRVYSLSVLNSIARFNPDGLLDLTEKVLALVRPRPLDTDDHWEIKTQCLVFACNMLRHLASKGSAPKEEVQSPTTLPKKPGSKGSQAAQQLDRNHAKKLTTDNLAIVEHAFNAHAPKSVQKLGLFELQDLLPDFKALYPTYVEILVTVEPDVRRFILSEEEAGNSQDIYFALGSKSLTYQVKSDVNHFDRATLAHALCDLVLGRGMDSLEKAHMEVLHLCTNGPLGGMQAESWFKVFARLKEYLFVAICDPELYEDSLELLSRFFTAEQLRLHVFEEAKEIFPKTLQILF